MKKQLLITMVVFVLGITVGAFAAKKANIPKFRGRDKKEVAEAMLALARTQAGKGSWENIAVGRVYYLAGMKKEAEEIFTAVTSRKPEGSDWMRIGRVYWEAGDWDKAKDAFDKALAKDRGDAPWLAEVGAYYNLKGDREKAEEMFDRSFSIESNELWSTVNIAGSYAGVEPRGNS